MNLDSIDRLLEDAIADGVFPGACYGVIYRGKTEMRAVGRYRYEEDSPPVTLDTVWDLASVSKVVGTTTAAMRLVDQGHLDIDAPVATVLPEFGQNGKEAITFKNLLVHDAGLVAFRRYHEWISDPDELLETIYAEGLEYPTGTQTIYSDLSMIVIGKAIERITGQPLNEFLYDRVFALLGIHQTGYVDTLGPTERWLPVEACAPTERTEPWRRTLHEKRGLPSADFIQGEVHDPTAMVLGGVAGHAGLFSTIKDLTRFMGALTRGEVVQEPTLQRFTHRQDPKSSRALGWDTKSEPSSAGPHFGPDSFGHTGYTGTSIWYDPTQDLCAILLTNRVHPTSENTKLLSFRPVFHSAIAQALNSKP